MVKNKQRKLNLPFVYNEYHIPKTFQHTGQGLVVKTVKIMLRSFRIGNKDDSSTQRNISNNQTITLLLGIMHFHQFFKQGLHLYEKHSNIYFILLLQTVSKKKCSQCIFLCLHFEPYSQQKQNSLSWGSFN